MRQVWKAWFVIAVVLLTMGVACTRAQARDFPEIAKTPPVGLVAAVSGDATIKYPEREAQKCFALDLVGPETVLNTGANGTIVVEFFYDGHSELLKPDSEGKVGFRNVTAVKGSVGTEKSKSGGNEFEVPVVTRLKLSPDFFKNVDDADEAKKEDDFMSAYVRVTITPPSFHWRDLKLDKYRLQIFNEKQEFVYETTSDKPTYVFPSKPPFNVIKGAVYYWQVLSPKDEFVVRRYPFKLLTEPQVKFLRSSQEDFDRVQAKMKGEQRSFTEQFLLYNQYRTIDKLVHLLQMWRDVEPENPNVHRYLARVYLIKGCPLRGRACIEKEGQLGLPDPIK